MLIHISYHLTLYLDPKKKKKKKKQKQQQQQLTFKLG